MKGRLLGKNWGTVLRRQTLEEGLLLSREKQSDESSIARAPKNQVKTVQEKNKRRNEDCFARKERRLRKRVGGFTMPSKYHPYMKKRPESLPNMITFIVNNDTEYMYIRGDLFVFCDV